MSVLSEKHTHAQRRPLISGLRRIYRQWPLGIFVSSVWPLVAASSGDGEAECIDDIFGAEKVEMIAWEWRVACGAPAGPQVEWCGRRRQVVGCVRGGVLR